MTNQRGDKAVSRRWRQVFGNLERYGEIEGSAKIETSRQIDRMKALPVDRQLVAGHVASVDAEEVVDARFGKGAQEMACSASDIKDRTRRHEIQNGRNNLHCRGIRPGKFGLEEICSIGRFGQFNNL